jgi:serine/threonine protein kinase
MLHNGIAKIADFGFSRMLETGMDDPAFISRLGSPLYMSPQILEGAMFSSKCDVWSVGVVFYEMLYGKTPWTGDSQTSLLQNVRDKPLKFPEYPPRSNKVKNIIRNMLKYKEDERPSWEEVFKYDLI